MTDDAVKVALARAHADDGPPSFAATMAAARRRRSPRRWWPAVAAASVAAITAVVVIAWPREPALPIEPIGMSTTTIRTSLDSLLAIPGGALLSSTPHFDPGELL